MSTGTVTTCSGTIYDPGGTGNYANSQTVTTTFCATGSQCISITFTAFDTEDGYDGVFVYDGTTTGSPLLAILSGDMGTPGATGVEVPSNISFTSSTGCITLRFTSDGSFTGSGFTATISCAACPSTQNYLINSMASTVSTCNGQFYDSGGSGGNYGNSQSFTRTICAANLATNCIGVTFSTLNLQNNDILTIYDGPSANAGYLLATCNGCNSPNAYVESSTGCLTFVWSSNASTVDPGWAAGIYCFPCNKQTNCLGATTVCSDVQMSGNSNGAGYAELTATAAGCNLDGEVESSWYVFSPTTSGTVQLSINTSVDYDFGIWGPFASGSTTSTICPPSAAPIRCSYSSQSGNTGLLAGSGDNSEGASGNAWVNEINVLAGEVYLMMVNNYSADGSSFTLDWTLTNGATFGCTVLPVELLQFTGKAVADGNFIEWKSASEENLSKYILEKSQDGAVFYECASFAALGGQAVNFSYAHLDKTPYSGGTYYRLKAIDKSNEITFSNIIFIDKETTSALINSVYPNPATNSVSVDFVSRAGEDFVVSLMDVTGKAVLSAPVQATEGINSVKFDLDGVSKGMYFLTITDKNAVCRQAKKLLIN